ncbi:MAG: PAS domain S-box protein [Lachnospiraceae bacterium]|jgi:PAS domain S-box-containing protein|nr:PAS domain S-box protein [Lachnospiraceae bacterium]
MDNKRIDIFKEFASYIEYPMVVFEADSGKVLDINYEAEVIIGKDIKNIQVEPGRTIVKDDFWEVLRTKKSLIWHRIRMIADGKQHLVSGLVNETTVDGKLIYTVLFELRADLNIGSLTLERIVNHAGVVALHVSLDENGERRVEYASQNINQYGYSRVQLYDRGMKVEDIVCPEDIESLEEALRNASENQDEESSFECRLLTEERELIPVRILFHYNYDENGKLTDYEALALDRKEEIRRSAENNYLSNAMFKMKSVLLVKSYHAGKRSIKYISPNAAMLGMNVEALQKGLKLTEDYIHPEDRDGVIDTIYQAVANGVADYVQTCRMVRDDGKQIWVENQVTINRVSDGEAEVSFLMTDITEHKEMEKELEKMSKNTVTAGDDKKAENKKTESGSEIDIAGQLQLLAESFGKNIDYYIVAIREDGSLITDPTGPNDDLGVFYDLFERPQYREQIKEALAQAKLQIIPKNLDIELSGISVHLIISPLVVDDDVKAYWVLSSINGKGLETINDVVEPQWRLAQAIIDNYSAKDMASSEVKNRKVVEYKLRREKQERKTLQELLNISYNEGEAGLGEMCQRMSVYLSVSHIGIFIENKEKRNAEKYFTWDQTGEDVAFFDRMGLAPAEMDEIRSLMGTDNGVCFTDTTSNPLLKELIAVTRMKMIAIRRLPVDFETGGYIVFGDAGRDTCFENNEKSFVDIASKIIKELVFSKRSGVKKDVIRDGFLETYDHIRDAVFVKNNETGEIIFANKAMEKLFGYSIVGMQAQEIVNDQMEQYRLIQGMRKRFIANNKVSKWQSYLKEVDQIMNVTEVQLSVFTNTNLSLVILKKNKNK